MLDRDGGAQRRRRAVERLALIEPVAVRLAGRQAEALRPIVERSAATSTLLWKPIRH